MSEHPGYFGFIGSYPVHNLLENCEFSDDEMNKSLSDLEVVLGVWFRDGQRSLHTVIHDDENLYGYFTEKRVPARFGSSTHPNCEICSSVTKHMSIANKVSPQDLTGPAPESLQGWDVEFCEMDELDKMCFLCRDCFEKLKKLDEKIKEQEHEFVVAFNL